MASWSEFADARPDLAEVGLRLLPPCGIAYLGSVRSDGGPRVHPVCPVLGGGRLFVGIGPDSPKQWDLRRDPRCVLHAMPGEDDAEFVIRARAIEVRRRDDRELFETACRAAGVNIEADGPVFELLIDRVDTTVWMNCGQPDTRPIRDRWVANRVAEQQLDGGIANAGQVVRVGPHVLRPSSPHSRSIHAFLRAVRQAGFDGAPSPIGIDDDGRERLVFIDGEVPLPPYPDWSQSDTALASIAMLLRGLHDAARGFDPRGLTWYDSLADPAGGTLVCHNDVCPENVVFRDGIAVALLDFEFAAPGRPVYDLAHLARLCVPIDDDYDQARLGWRPADRPARLRLVADAYGLDRDGRTELLTAMNDAIARVEAAVRRSVDAGDPNSVAMWNRTGGSERYDRRRRWWADHHDQFAAALR
jgi:phosphotransferase family enzyme